MFSSQKTFVVSLVALGTAFLAGCSDSLGGRMAVSGAVKLEGQPLKDGSIDFVPLDGQDTQSGAGITNGTYSVPRDHGLKPGKYLVRLTSGDGKTPDREEDIAGPSSSNIVSVDRIPPEWNTDSKQQVDVKSSGGNHFDFDIPNINPRLKKR
jgi:hypothetical protein